jgi:O-antigen/teichoic acid export membrane protein
MNVRRSLLLASAASNGAALIGFASSMILARLLIPSEVGVFSIAAALIGLVGSLRDFGVSAYLIRSPQLDRAKIAASYGVMIVVSWTLALLIALASPLAAMLYRDPRVGDLMLILALNLMLVPFGALTMAYLTREMQFGAQFVLNISSAIANAGIAVALAWQGYGAYSLAWAGLGSTLVTILVSLFYRPAWWPLLPTLKGWREVVSFGAPVTGGAVIGNLNNASVDLITGQMIGPEAVALYGKALSIRSLFEQFFMAAIRLVALPHFATLARNNVELRTTYLQASNMLTGIGWPFAAILMALSEPLVLLMFGSSWLGSAPLVVWTALWMIISLPCHLVHSVLIAMGHAGSLLKGELTMLTVKCLVVVLVAPLGIEAVAIALLAAVVRLCAGVGQPTAQRDRPEHRRSVSRSAEQRACGNRLRHHRLLRPRILPAPGAGATADGCLVHDARRPGVACGRLGDASSAGGRDLSPIPRHDRRAFNQVINRP